MKREDPKKKIWSKPVVVALDIKKHTSGGSRPGNEKNDASKYGPPGLS